LEVPYKIFSSNALKIIFFVKSQMKWRKHGYYYFYIKTTLCL